MQSRPAYHCCTIPSLVLLPTLRGNCLTADQRWGWLFGTAPVGQSVNLKTVKQNRADQCRAFCVRQKKRNLAADATLSGLSKHGGRYHDQPSPFCHCSFGASPDPISAR